MCVCVCVCVCVSHRNGNVGGKKFLDVFTSVIHVTFLELRQLIVARLLCGTVSVLSVQ